MALNLNIAPLDAKASVAVAEAAVGDGQVHDGPYAWGYCFLREQEPKSSYCDPKYPCPNQYFGRGPIQLSCPQHQSHPRHNVIMEIGNPLLPIIRLVPVPLDVITNIINGGIECGHGVDSKVQDRIGFYKRYCDMLGVGYGNNL
ncbi:hypothetical protein Patl1_35755 [Pistacia atlantica]|nr:hypothetical protein Patl1_35755 [Pistacia atlantica]